MLAQRMLAQKVTKLLNAACRGHLEQCLLLLRSGADVNGVNDEGMTALMIATLKNQVAVVKILLEHSCDLDLTTNHGRTALHLAVWNKRTTITQLLLKHGCNPNIQDRFGDTPLMLATLRGYIRLVKALLVTQRCDLHAAGPEKDTVLHYAARHGRPECISLLKAHGTDIEVKNMWGLTALLTAAMHGNPLTGIELIKNGGDINVCDREKRSVLHHAVRNNLSSLVVELLRKGSDLSAKDVYGNKPLTEAIQHSEPKIIAFLIRANCDVNSKGTCIVGQSSRKYTPVVIALHQEKYEVADLLIQSGCDKVELRHELASGLLERKFKDNVKMQQWCRHTFNEPNSLVVLSRKALIKHLRSIPFAELNMVIIPPGLEDCLNYRDVLNSCTPSVPNKLFHYSKMQILVRF